MGKITKFLLGTVLLGGVAGYFLAGGLLGRLTVSAVNTFGPDLTGTAVTLGSARLSPVTGGGWMKDLFVGNPPGYVSPKALSVGRLSIAVKPFSLIGDTLEIDEIVVEQPEFIVESKLVTSNLQEIVKHARGLAKEARPAGTPGEPGPGKKLILRRFVFENAKVRLSVAGAALETTIPRFELAEIGTAKGGVTAAEAVAEVLPQVLGAVLEAGAKTAGQQGLEERLKEFGRELKDAAKSLIGK